MSVIDDNLAPIRECTDPDGVPALRRVLGLFLQSARFIKNYDMRIAKLTRLTGKLRGSGERKSMTCSFRYETKSARVLLSMRLITS